MMITTQQTPQTSHHSVDDLLALYTETMLYPDTPASNLIGFMRGASLAMRVLASVIVITFTMLILAPTAQAAREELNTPDAIAKAAPETSDEAEFSKKLQQLEKKLEKLQEKLDQGLDGSVELADVRQLDNTLRQLDTVVTQHFDELRSWIEAQGLSAEILQRHDDTVSTYRAELTMLLSNLEAVDTATDETDRKNKVGQALGHLKSKQNKRPHQPFDPNNLPFSTPDSDVRAPIEDPAEFQALMHQLEPIQVAARGELKGLLSKAASPTPQPEDLLPTEDVQITPDIQALAQSLNNNPVEIYNWVRNNIVFLPTYGSIQGSQMTLEARQGNAFDTTSLLIALLRAANIPARYVYGTVQIPVDQVMNWVGGVTTAEAAMQLLGQGAIPNTGLIEGGVIKAIKLEHIWVEAWVDFEPSRGAKNVEGDSWVPLDASFKQSEFVRSSILDTINFDADQFATTILQSAEIDVGLSSATNLNFDHLNDTVLGFLDEITNAMRSTPNPVPPLELVGKYIINPIAVPILATNLPYKVINILDRIALLPSSMRHMATIRIFYGKLAQLSDSPASTHSFPLTALRNPNINLTFNAASEADQSLWDSYGGQVTFPLYMIQVKPVLSINGETVLEGPALAMGSNIFVEIAITGPRQPTLVDYELVSGDEAVFSFNIAGLTPSYAELLLSRIIPETASGNLEVLATTYWMEVDTLNDMLAPLFEATRVRLPSVGLFATPLTVDYFFSIPRRGTYSSRLGDVNLSRQAVVAKDTETRLAFIDQSGLLLSALESLAPDQVFMRPTGTTVSAVQLMRVANATGIPIHTITPTNRSAILPLLQVEPEVYQDIVNGLNAGFEITIPRQTMSQDNWTGSGYFIVDPITGSGAYRITGGLNGLHQPDCDGSTQPLISPVNNTVAGFFLALIASLVDSGDNDLSGGAVVVALVITIAVAYVLFVPPKVPAVATMILGALIVGLNFLGVAEAKTDIQRYGCGCDPIRIPHKGWHFRHNLCADEYPPNDWFGSDAFVYGKAFDAIRQGPKLLYEIKTNRYRWYPDSLKRLVKIKDRAEFFNELARAQRCQYEYRFVVTDPIQFDDYQFMAPRIEYAGLICGQL